MPWRKKHVLDLRRRQGSQRADAVGVDPLDAGTGWTVRSSPDAHAGSLGFALRSRPPPSRSSTPAPGSRRSCGPQQHGRRPAAQHEPAADLMGAIATTRAASVDSQVRHVGAQLADSPAVNASRNSVSKSGTSRGSAAYHDAAPAGLVGLPTRPALRATTSRGSGRRRWRDAASRGTAGRVRGPPDPVTTTRPCRSRARARPST